MCLMNFCQQPGTVSCCALTATARFDQFGFIFFKVLLHLQMHRREMGAAGGGEEMITPYRFSVLLNKPKND